MKCFTWIKCKVVFSNMSRSSMAMNTNCTYYKKRKLQLLSPIFFPQYSFQTHSQWLENVHAIELLDVIGKNNFAFYSSETFHSELLKSEKIDKFLKSSRPLHLFEKILNDLPSAPLIWTFFGIFPTVYSCWNQHI